MMSCSAMYFAMTSSVTLPKLRWEFVLGTGHERVAAVTAREVVGAQGLEPRGLMHRNHGARFYRLSSLGCFL